MFFLWMFLIAIIAIIIQHMYFRLIAHKHLEYERRFNRFVVHSGDKLVMTETISNRARTPIPTILVESILPASFSFGVTDDLLYMNKGDYYQNHRSLYSLPKYTEIKREFEITCKQRGTYKLSGMFLTMSDIAGFKSYYRKSPTQAEIVVYPKISPIMDLPVPARGWLETIFSRETKINENHFNFNGIRSYRQGDSLRSISWKATAKTNQLMVNKRETITDHHCWIILNVQDRLDGRTKPTNLDQLEHAVSYVASIAAAALKQGCTVGFATNGKVSEDLKAAKGAKQLQTILLTLASLEFEVKESFHRYLSLKTEAMRSQNIFIISTIMDDSIKRSIDSIRKHGNHVSYLLLR
jgi:uncharacterized protein (DUF58 family)